MSTFVLILAEPPAESKNPAQFVDAWKPQVYGTNFMMTNQNGAEIGVATLEYIPPYVKKVTQCTADFEDCGKIKTAIEKTVLF